MSADVVSAYDLFQLPSQPNNRPVNGGGAFLPEARGLYTGDGQHGALSTVRLDSAFGQGVGFNR